MFLQLPQTTLTGCQTAGKSFRQASHTPRQAASEPGKTPHLVLRTSPNDNQVYKSDNPDLSRRHDALRQAAHPEVHALAVYTQGQVYAEAER